MLLMGREIRYWLVENYYTSRSFLTNVVLRKSDCDRIRATFYFHASFVIWEYHLTVKYQRVWGTA